MTHIHWYPGHIAKAERKLKEQLSLVDVVIEIIDARIPLSSMYPDISNLVGQKPRLILLNKSDLADIEPTKAWLKIIKAQTGATILLTSANNSKDLNLIVNKAIELSQPAIIKLVQKGLLPRAARAMVVGMPNVGKSSIINKLIKKTKAKTGAKAGVTRQQQWVRINPRLDLLDTPGIIPLKQEEQEKANKLAFVNSIGENAYDSESVGDKFIEVISDLYPNLLNSYYKLDGADILNLENIALKRNWIVSGGKADTKRAAQNMLLDFREGRLGKLTLDKIEENE
ncbi:MAG: ribosome biogenesis GTPase YlqF [Candidatus Gastranaerophilales bacterium]|nr:ribosome biogenesis GTPase YlqF [Candidatus Gastranaerophilales bacterium]